MNSGAREGYTVPASYQTPTVLLITGKSLGSNRGKKTSMQKVKDPLSFEIWIFHNGQPDCDHDRRIFVAMTSTLKQRSLVWVAFVSAAELCPENHCTGHRL